MNPALQLTYARIGLAFVFMGCLFTPGTLAKWLAIAIFAIGSLTDFYDGWLARRLNCVTELGKLLDPIADKVLTLSAFLAFVELGIVPAWPVVLILTRELLVTGLRFLAAGRGVVLPARGAGKHKMVSQVIAIIAILLYLAVRGLPVASGWQPAFDRWGLAVIWWIMVVTAASTILSGVTFLWQHREIYGYADRR